MNVRRGSLSLKPCKEAPMESNGLHSCSTNEEAAVKPGALPSELLVYPPTGRTKKLVRKENISRDEGKQFSAKQQALVFVANLQDKVNFGAQLKPSHQGLGSKVPNKQRYNHWILHLAEQGALVATPLPKHASSLGSSGPSFFSEPACRRHSFCWEPKSRRPCFRPLVWPHPLYDRGVPENGC